MSGFVESCRGLVLVGVCLLAAVCTKGQPIKVDLSPLNDGRQIGSAGNGPFKAWRQTDGSYIYTSSGAGTSGAYHLVHVDPDELDYRFLSTTERIVTSAPSDLRSAVHDSVYYCITAIEYDFHGPSNTALYTEDLRTGVQQLHSPPDVGMEKISFTSMDVGSGLVVLSALRRIYILDKGNNWTRLNFDSLRPTYQPTPAYFVYSRGQHHLIYVEVLDAFFYTHDGGETWTADSTLFTRIYDATVDHATNEWYCVSNDGVFTVDSTFAFHKVDLGDGTWFPPSIQVHGGIVVLHTATGYPDEVHQYRVQWDRDTQPFSFSASGSQPWGDVAFTSSGDAIVYGSGTRLIRISRDGERDTVFRDHSTHMQRIVGLDNGSFLSGGSSKGLRQSMDGLTWHSVWNDSIDGVRDIAADGSNVFVIDTAGLLYRSTDAAVTFELLEGALHSCLEVVHVVDDTFVLRYETGVGWVAATGSPFMYVATPMRTTAISASMQGSVSVLLENGSIHELSSSASALVELPGLDPGVASLSYDRNGRLWINSPRFGPNWLDRDQQAWVPQRVNAPISYDGQLYRTLGDELVLTNDKYNPTTMVILDEDVQHWRCLTDSTGLEQNLHSFLDTDRTSIYTGHRRGTRIADPQWNDRIMQWEPYGVFERFVGLEPRRSTAVIDRPGRGPLIQSHDGLHSFDNELRAIEDQFYFNAANVISTGDDSSLIGLRNATGSGAIVQFNVNTFTTDTLEVTGRDSADIVRQIAVSQGDTLWLSSTISELGTEETYTLHQGLNAPTIVGSTVIPANGTRKITKIFTAEDGRHGFLIMFYLDTLFLDIVMESAPPVEVRIEADNYYHNVAVNGSMLAVLSQPIDSVLRHRVETYDLRGRPLSSEVFPRNKLYQFIDLDFIAEGRFLLLQTDTIYLLDPETLDTRSVVSAEHGALRSPVAYHDWILGTYGTTLLRWQPLGVVLSADNAEPVRKLTSESHGTVEWSAYFNSTGLHITDPDRTANITYRLYTLAGAMVWESSATNSGAMDIAVGPYILTRSNSLSGTMTSTTLMVMH